MLANPIGVIRHYGQRILSHVVSNGKFFAFYSCPLLPYSIRDAYTQSYTQSYGLVIPNPTKDDLQPGPMRARSEEASVLAL